MRHLKIGRKLNRNSSHRLSMLRNMSISLIYYECIQTTLSKAKELQRFIDPLVTFSKFNNLFNYKLILSRICNKTAVFKLFNKLGPKFINRKGGYTSILKCGFRSGDNAHIVYIRFV
ncbi:MAG: 50S ribosomal protein L17 [gamma proteobacterium endosymbiont of Trioza apicalis]